MSAEQLTNEREKTHGKYRDHAGCTQALKKVVRQCLQSRRSRGDDDLNYQQLESVEMILHKIGRIVAGDPNFQDHWDDIAGYAHIANKDYTNAQPERVEKRVHPEGGTLTTDS